MELFKPRGASAPRNPTTDKQANGQIINTPRFAHMGGLSGPTATKGTNNMTIKPPGDGKKVI